MVNQNLEQNQEQTVEKLLEKYITVPEIQREYVWGSDKKLLEIFLNDIMDTVGDNKPTTYNIGFLYSYAHSTREEYLIDGQQRFTTLMLLAIYLAKVEDNTSRIKINSLLKVEEPQQAFTYRVRSSAATFLHSLCLKELDVRPDVMIKEVITASTWYVGSVYENDTTVQNMLNTLQIIHQWFTTKGAGRLALNDILTKVMFWHFNTKQTGQGEELYISMNSRGCPLTEAEQIKPLLFKDLDAAASVEYGKKWDEWENTFFKMSGENRDISVVDKAMRMMIRTAIELEETTQKDGLNPREDAELVKLPTIESYMDVIESLSQDYQEEIERLFGDSDGDSRLYVLKRLIIEKKRGRNDERDLNRVVKIVANGLRRGTINHIPLLEFFKAYVKDSTSTFYEFVRNNPSLHKGLFDEHEVEKIIMYDEYDKDKQASLEEVCWQAETHILWGGDISILLRWSKNDGLIDLDSLKKYKGAVDMLFKDQNYHPKVSDETRRSLVSRNLDNYPLTSDYKYAKFGYSPYEWKLIFEKNKVGVKDFLNDAVEQNGVPSTDNSQEDYKFKEVVDNEYLLEYCNYKHFYWTDDHGWLLVKNQWAQPIAVFNKHMYEKYKEDPLFINDGWEIRIWINWDGCVVIENTNKDIAFDLWKVRTTKTELVDGEEVSKKVVICKARVFRRNHTTDFEHPDGWTKVVDDDTEKVKCYQYENTDEKEVLDKIGNLIKGYNEQAND